MLTSIAVDCFVYYKKKKKCCVWLSVQRGREEEWKEGNRKRERVKEECGWIVKIVKVAKQELINEKKTTTSFYSHHG